MHPPSTLQDMQKGNEAFTTLKLHYANKKEQLINAQAEAASTAAQLQTTKSELNTITAKLEAAEVSAMVFMSVWGVDSCVHAAGSGRECQKSARERGEVDEGWCQRKI